MLNYGMVHSKSTDRSGSVSLDLQQIKCRCPNKNKKTAAQLSTAVPLMILLIHTETLLELIDTSACVNKLLLACVVRMALRANFDSDVLLCGTCVNNVAASTSDRCFLVVRMDSFLHFNTSSLLLLYD